MRGSGSPAEPQRVQALVATVAAKTKLPLTFYSHPMISRTAADDISSLKMPASKFHTSIGLEILDGGCRAADQLTVSIK